MYTLEVYIFKWLKTFFFLNINKLSQGFPWWSDDKESACNAADQIWVLSLGCEHPLEKGLATHSSILAFEIPWTEEPDRLQSRGLQRVGHN